MVNNVNLKMLFAAHLQNAVVDELAVLATAELLTASVRAVGMIPRSEVVPWEVLQASDVPVTFVVNR
jgi:hypothetical protein